jgi:hypothetical protein
MRWKHLVAAPALIAAVLPKFACPACAAAAIGVLGSLGLGYLLTAAYLLPITSVLLALALVALAFGAAKRRGYGPFLIGTVAAVGVLLGKFKWESVAAMYSAVGLLFISSLWDAWPRRSSAGTCSGCRPVKLQPGLEGQK